MKQSTALGRVTYHSRERLVGHTCLVSFLHAFIVVVLSQVYMLESLEEDLCEHRLPTVQCRQENHVLIQCGLLSIVGHRLADCEHVNLRPSAHYDA